MSEQRPDQRPVLLISGNHTTRPLWKPLSEHFDLCITHAQQAAMAMDMGLPGAFGIGQLLTADVQEEAVNLSYRLSAKVQQAANARALNSVITEAFSASERPPNFAAPYVNNWWPGFVGEHVRNQSLMVFLVNRLIAQRKVVGCVVHEDVTPDMRALVRACQHHNLPTIHVPHANCFYVGEDWDIHTESISDYILAAGTHMRDFYTHWGYRGEIRITGAPQWDDMLNGERPPRSEARRVLGLSADTFVLIYATTWGQLTTSKGGAGDDDILHNLQGALEAARELPQAVGKPVELLIKMHPGEAQGNEQAYHAKLAEAGVDGCVMRGYNEYVLAAGDAMLAHAPSNLCCQAAQIGMPSAYYTVEDYAFPFPGPIMVRDNATYAVKVALRVEKTWEPFSKMVNDAYPEGNAVERIVREIVDICK